jgi:hypothetical protein
MKINRKGYRAAAKGAAAESLVEADLLLRGLEVTRPTVDFGDDLHARFSVGWRSVQVKTRDIRRKLWRPSDHRKRVTSEILALVDSVTREIRYVKASRERLPKELVDG